MIKTVLFAVAEKECPDRDPHGGVGLCSDHVDVEDALIETEDGGATSFSSKTAEQKVTTRTRGNFNPPIKGI